MDALNQTLERTSVQSIENEAQANAAAAEAYLRKVEELGAVQNRTEEQEFRYQGALAGLLEVAPELSDCISQTADEYGRVTYAVEGATSAIWDNIEAMKQQAVMAGLQDYLSELGKNQASVMVDIQLAKIDRQAVIDQKDELMRQEQSLINEINAVSTGSFNDSAVDAAMLQSRLEDLQGQINYTDNQIAKYNTALEPGDAALAESEKETLAVKNALDDLAESLGFAKDGASGFSGGMEAASESAEGMAGPLDTVTERMAELSKAYASAYEAALASVRGQYNLWDEAEKIESSSLDKIGQAMDSQAANWTARLENLDLLSAYEGQIEGLSDLLDSLALDNSKEGVNLLAGLADSVRQGEGGIKKLEEFAGKYTALQEKQEEYAGRASELKTDLEKANAELLEAVDESIAGMDRSHDAENAAHAVIQAYIDEANNPDNLSAVRSAYGKAAAEAIRALSEAYDPLSGGSVGGLTPTAILRSEANRYDRAWAEGGILTQPHIGLVAEDGPEAVIPLSASRRDRGAEIWEEAGRRMGLLSAAYHAGAAGWDMQSLSSDMTGAVLLKAAVSTPDTSINAEPLEAMPLPGFSSAPVNVAVHIHLEAGADRETVEALDDLVRRGELGEIIRTEVEDMVQDKKRLAFA